MMSGVESTRLSREQSKAHTRARLLDAARTVFARGGYHGSSVELIASEAGFSTGALYSNFDGKEDLFLALMGREIDAHARELATAVESRRSVAERATGGARQWMIMIEREPELLLLFMEFLGLRRARPRGAPKGRGALCADARAAHAADRRRHARLRS